MSFTIQNVLVPVAQGYATVDVQVVGERISAIEPHQEVVGTAVDGQNKLLLPGFVNAHTHSSEMWQRGIIPFLIGKNGSQSLLTRLCQTCPFRSNYG